jgi:hypothetical protein
MRDYMYGPVIHTLGIIPVTQQGVGLFLAGAGIVFTVARLAKLVFYQMQKLFSDGLNSSVLENKISRNNEGITHALEILGWGVLTCIPVAGNVANGYCLYQELKERRYVTL